VVECKKLQINEQRAFNIIWKNNYASLALVESNKKNQVFKMLICSIFFPSYLSFLGSRLGLYSQRLRSLHLPIAGRHWWKAGQADQ